MTVMDTENALFQAKRTALAFSLILLPGTVLHLITGYPLFEPSRQPRSGSFRASPTSS